MKKIAAALLIAIFATLPSPEFAIASNSLHLSAFNIQVLGRSKVSKSHVMEHLTNILNRNDLTFIQEIRDNTDEAIYKLQEQTNRFNSHKYQITVSKALGRTSSREQYAYLYNDDRIKLIHSEVYQDWDDRFEREPYIAIWQTPGAFRFATIGIHVKPDDVEQELRALGDVVSYVKDQHSMNAILVMGDLNADCDYFNPESLGFSMIDHKIKVWIEDHQDTTVSATHCAYDRFITTEALSPKVSKAAVFDYQEAYNLSLAAAKKVSDHYPIELQLNFASQEPPSTAPSKPMPNNPNLPSTCGLKPYWTPKNYCYATKDGSKKRVSASCCS
ncbi:endonuclease/exonuclease/phosphatase family protein [Pseudobacteriovorax antillogorgiicola]|nr:endonuclease/exonuclease/phosphatase family protein [Pseudobacteriovorax antillogorgiicola]